MTFARPKPPAVVRYLCVLAVTLVAVAIWLKPGRLSSFITIARYRMVRSTAERLAFSPWRDAVWVRLVLGDFGGLESYRDADRALPPATVDRVLLYGDSITEYWVSYAPETFFPGRSYIGRGIQGQTTPELLWRFQQDVLDLHPRTVVLLGGTNDIVFTRLHLSEDETERNLERMATVARERGIRVVLCSLLPSAYKEPAQQRQVLRGVLHVNAWLKGYAAANDLRYVDYFSSMAGPDGVLRPELRRDALHPNAAGYRLMERVLTDALDDPMKN